MVNESLNGSRLFPSLSISLPVSGLIPLHSLQRLSSGAPRKLSIRGENAYTVALIEWCRPRSSGSEIYKLHDYDKGLHIAA